MRRKIQRTRSDTTKLTKIYRNKVIFEFTVEGKKYKNNSGRLKISEEGYINFLIKEDSKWKPKKGELVNLKVVKEVCGFIKENIS